MSLFDKEFFPTPVEVAVKMLTPYVKQLRTATILEPSAGSGSILDVLTKSGVPYIIENLNGIGNYETETKADPKRVYAIEKNEELTMILQQKGYKVIGRDFLSFRPEHRFDLVVMNPPFRLGMTTSCTPGKSSTAGISYVFSMPRPSVTPSLPPASV